MYDRMYENSNMISFILNKWPISTKFDLTPFLQHKNILRCTCILINMYQTKEKTTGDHPCTCINYLLYIYFLENIPSSTNL